MGPLGKNLLWSHFIISIDRWDRWIIWEVFLTELLEKPESKYPHLMT